MRVVEILDLEHLHHEADGTNRSRIISLQLVENNYFLLFSLSFALKTVVAASTSFTSLSFRASSASLAANAIAGSEPVYFDETALAVSCCCILLLLPLLLSRRPDVLARRALPPSTPETPVSSVVVEDRRSGSGATDAVFFEAGGAIGAGGGAAKEDFD